ncbi:proline-rich protein 36-like [Simochromis diagramma]|uniref:proline-rich protein 36-like n=1 Tax=Simochromis diagramma TaxID=43689 RepID=UPI001A7F0F77|nr:proline-rich protein 36-like [Simochromis diagramma]XP_039901297.1 proline-rich protein 36-like [Simochromis diagramma]XP_039901298.1 proline-rich protein 36-like [Simochromis diagramma]XP_039901299.1 proline-rich protein 36-like [Simochromis diagramma]
MTSMDPADSLRKRSSPFDGTRLALGGPPCCCSSLAAYPSAHVPAYSPRTPRSHRKRSSRSWEDYYETASNQLTPAQAFYKMLGIIIVPPDSPSVSTSQQEQPQLSLPSSHSASAAPSSTGKQRTRRQHSQLQQEPGMLCKQPPRVSDRVSLHSPFMSRDKQTVSPKAANASFMNTRARVSPVRENKSIRFENDFFPLGSKDCAPDVPSDPGVKTVSSGTVYSWDMFFQAAARPPSAQLPAQQPPVAQCPVSPAQFSVSPAQQPPSAQFSVSPAQQPPSAQFTPPPQSAPLPVAQSLAPLPIAQSLAT